MSDRCKRILIEWVIPYGLLIVIMLLLNNFVFFLIFVPSGSMIPTIDEYSCLFTTRVHNPERRLARGDVVVFWSDELNEKMVKRLVGMPGETVLIDDNGKVFIDGAPLEEPYVKRPSPSGGAFQVPEDCYFFLGDNRRSSLDARAWSNPYISADKIEGKVAFTLWPLSNFGLLK